MDGKYIIFRRDEGNFKEIPITFPCDVPFGIIVSAMNSLKYKPIRAGIYTLSWSGVFECSAAKDPVHLAELRRLRIASMLAVDSDILNTRFP